MVNFYAGRLAILRVYVLAYLFEKPSKINRDAAENVYAGANGDA